MLDNENQDTVQSCVIQPHAVDVILLLYAGISCLWLLSLLNRHTSQGSSIVNRTDATRVTLLETNPYLHLTFFGIKLEKTARYGILCVTALFDFLLH